MYERTNTRNVLCAAESPRIKERIFYYLSECYCCRRQRRCRCIWLIGKWNTPENKLNKWGKKRISSHRSSSSLIIAMFIVTPPEELHLVKLMLANALCEVLRVQGSGALRKVLISDTLWTTIENTCFVTHALYSNWQRWHTDTSTSTYRQKSH